MYSIVRTSSHRRPDRRSTLHHPEGNTCPSRWWSLAPAGFPLCVGWDGMDVRRASRRPFTVIRIDSGESIRASAAKGVSGGTPKRIRHFENQKLVLSEVF